LEGYNNCLQNTVIQEKQMNIDSLVDILRNEYDYQYGTITTTHLFEERVNDIAQKRKTLKKKRNLVSFQEKPFSFISSNNSNQISSSQTPISLDVDTLTVKIFFFELI
jgi:hypothetical protein